MRIYLYQQGSIINRMHTFPKLPNKEISNVILSDVWEPLKNEEFDGKKTLEWLKVQVRHHFNHVIIALLTFLL